MALDPIAQSICPVPLRLGAIRGDSIDVRLRLIDASTGRPIVLTGWDGEASVWDSINADVPVHSLTVGVDQSPAAQPTTGVVTITALPGATTLWKLDGFWSLTMTSATVRKTIIAGPWKMVGPGGLPAGFVCGVCSTPELEQVGSSCVVLQDGYQGILLPYPQGECEC
jgi:hypothetical protein